METTNQRNTANSVAQIANQITTASAFQIVEINLSRIVSNPYNPRKKFSEESLLELSENIRQFGVLQPIHVRETKEADAAGMKMYELIFGERRYAASVMAEKETIPAVIVEATDEEAFDIAITENMHRVDITPFEEAAAFKQLLDSGRYDPDSLAAKFGKSKTHIQGRLKLLDLIPEVAALLNDETISLGMALELSKYDGSVQSDVYTKHLTENCNGGSWRPLKINEFAKRLREAYTTQLDSYLFDKTECNQCLHNTNTQLLFQCESDCARCLNRDCLIEKNNTYLINSIVEQVTHDPLLRIGVPKNGANAEVAQYLKEIGYETFPIDYYTRAISKDPEAPKIPQAENYNTTEEFDAAQIEYQRELAVWNEAIDEIQRRLEQGVLQRYICAYDKELRICYEDLMLLKGQAKNPVVELKKQDEHNLELSRGNIIKSTVKIFTEAKVPVTEITEMEDKGLYFAMLAAIKSRFKLLLRIKQIKEYTTDEAMYAVVNKLTASQKILIKRVFLMSALSEAGHDSPRYELLEQFATTYFPDEFGEIHRKYKDLYVKRHEQIEAKIRALQLIETREIKEDKVVEEQPSEILPTTEIPDELEIVELIPLSPEEMPQEFPDPQEEEPSADDQPEAEPEDVPFSPDTQEFDTMFERVGGEVPEQTAVQSQKSKKRNSRAA